MKHWHRHYHSPWRRSVYAFAVVGTIMGVGTMGIRALEGLSYLDAFYFMSMIATAQGPITVPHTAAGKLFTAVMSFLSTGVVVAALGFLFGPFFTRLWRLSVRKLESDEQQAGRLKK